MRILIINYEFPPIGGGAANASAQIAKELAKLGEQVKVLSSYFKGLNREEERDGYEISRALALRYRLDRSSPLEMVTFIFGGVILALKIVKEFKPQVVIAFFGIPCGPLAYLIKKINNTPYIISLRGGDVPGFSPEELRGYHFILKPAIKHLWKEADRIVANSQGLKELALKTYPEGKIDVIPNGVDLEAFRPPHSKKSEGSKTLLYVGRMTKQKGISFLIEAIPFLSKKVRLELVGDGPLRGRLESLVKRLGVYERVHFSGWLSQDELIKKYQQADLFVLPSLDEGMPNCILEAMACGLPIVATYVSGSRELVQSGVNGFLVSSRDREGLIVAIEEILKDESLRRQMGEKSLDLASKYSWSRVAKGYLIICEQVIKEDVPVS